MKKILILGTAFMLLNGWTFKNTVSTEGDAILYYVVQYTVLDSASLSALQYLCQNEGGKKSRTIRLHHKRPQEKDFLACYEVSYQLKKQGDFIRSAPVCGARGKPSYTTEIHKEYHINEFLDSVIDSDRGSGRNTFQISDGINFDIFYSGGAGEAFFKVEKECGLPLKVVPVDNNNK
ncbi:MAG: hypothetical protein GDA39_06615 [Hyphomonadaceae bacterium]|nr:hypothetical protein [Hyphomonadaceae bacterium]MBC6412564.1 hypothetical protein [Hyphomonadaceae bacterium]